MDWEPESSEQYSKVVLPSAVPGILSGIILATGRIVGETAALIYTAGSVAKMATKLTDSTRTLAVHMYFCQKERTSHGSGLCNSGSASCNL